MAKKIYISGPMTGIANANREEFFKANARLAAYGYTVLNPAVNPEGLSYDEYMAIDMAMLQVCDAIYMLTGYQKSPGARAELALAESLKFNVFYQDNGDFMEVGKEMIATLLSTDGHHTEEVKVGLSI